jgi:hypothetical protein
VEEHGVPDEL